MYARRFLGCIFVLTLLFVAGAFAFYEWGDRLLINQAIPKGHFVADLGAGRTDYHLARNWISRPNIYPEASMDPARWLPAGTAETSADNAAIFYIHPTTYLSTAGWNAPIEPGGDTEFRTQLFVRSQASAFNVVGEIWAPRYPQAAFGAFLLKSEDARQALDYAYRDVAAAFDQFVKEAGDRPIILAGHSQGALHLERLLKEKVAGTPLAKRIVAAYVVGWPISTSSDLPALGLPACRTAGDAGCILSWMTFGDPPNPDFILRDWAKTKGFNGGKRRQDDVLCVNPISGMQNGAAAAADNPGTLIPTADMSDASLRSGAVGAHCDKGLLILDSVPPAAGGFVLPGNNYHAYDYALFWGAIRRDAARRLAAWRR